MPEAKMEVQRERQKPKTHKPECACWRCGRHPVSKEESMPGATNRIVPDDNPVELPAGAQPYLV
jgi:hypothetical protein